MTDRHEPEYPLEPSEADLDRENLDAQEPVISLGESAEHLAFAELAALRFNLREWQDRARDMERERDAAERRAEEQRLRLLHELLATLDRDFAQVISPADAWSEALIRVGALVRRAEQAEAERDRNAIAYSACREAAAQHRWLVHGDAGEPQ